jgi:hypothetical protein
MRIGPSLPSTRSLVLALAVAIAIPSQPAISQSSGDSSRVAGWRSDIAFYLQQMKSRHYSYRDRALPPGLIDAAAKLSRNVPSYSDERMLAEFEYLASFGGDGHTYMLPFGSRRVASHMIPLRMFLFSDGLYVIDAFQGYEKWIGARVMRIGNTPAETVIGRIRPTLSADNRFTYLWVVPALLSFRGFLEKFADGIGSGDVALTLRLRNGNDVRVSVPTVVAPQMRGIPKLPPPRMADAPAVPLYLSNVAEFLAQDPAEQRPLFPVQSGDGLAARDPGDVCRATQPRVERGKAVSGNRRRASQQWRKPDAAASFDHCVSRVRGGAAAWSDLRANGPQHFLRRAVFPRRNGFADASDLCWRAKQLAPELCWRGIRGDAALEWSDR